MCLDSGEQSRALGPSCLLFIPSLEAGEWIIGMLIICLSNHQSITLCVHSISLETFKRFSLNFGQILILVRLFAEFMTQLCRLVVKVTVKGNSIYPSVSCPLHISFTPQRVFMKLWSIVHLSQMVCRTHDSAV